jgi:hypothetical protein
LLLDDSTRFTDRVQGLETDVDTFGDSLDAAWTRVDSTTSTEATWTTFNSFLVCTQQQAGSSANGHALLRALSGIGGTLAVGDGVIASLSFLAPPVNYVSFGLMLADGTTSGAGNQLFGSYGYDSTVGWISNLVTMTNFSGTGSNATGRWGLTTTTAFWLRLAKVGSTSYRLDVSPDGDSWWPALNAVTSSTTFTHAGFYASTFGGAARFAARVGMFGRVSGVS